MKTKILFLLLSASFSIFSQLQEVYLDWQYNVSQYKSADTDSIFIDGDNLVDIIINSWFLYESTYENLGIEATVIDHDGNFTSTPTAIGKNNIGQIRDCHQSGQSELTAYIYSNNAPIVNSSIDQNYTSGYKKVPFDFEAADGIHCGFLFVRYEENSNQELVVTVEGYYWNPVLKNQTGGSCPCNSDYLGLMEIKPNQIDVPYQFYDLLGQQIDNPQGLAIKAFKNGYVEKVYINSK